MRDLLNHSIRCCRSVRMPSTRSTRPRIKVVTLSQAHSVSPAEGLQDRRSARTGFRQDIEGLRAVAVLAVVLFHVTCPVWVVVHRRGRVLRNLRLPDHRAALARGEQRRYRPLRRFYGARARRLLPASATVGVVTAIASAVLLSPLQAQSVLKMASPARCMSATTGSFYRASTTCPQIWRRRRFSTTGRWASRSSSTWCGRP